MTSVLPVPRHLGSVHPYETALFALLAFGPFVVLGLLVMVIRGRNSATEDEQRSGSSPQPEASESSHTESCR